MNDEQIEQTLRNMAAAAASMLLDWTGKKTLPIDKLATVEAGVAKLNRQILMGR